VLYDENFIYFAFRCADDNIWSTMKRRDQHLWERRSWRFSSRPNSNQPSYIELEVNPLGANVGHLSPWRA